MSKTILTATLGTTLIAGAMASGIVLADNPFSAQSLSSGYMVLAAADTAAAEAPKAEGEKAPEAAPAADAKAAEGSCGGKMMAAEGSCGAKMANHMAEADADKDGKISKEEFLKHHEQMFDKADANKDGAIDADEMKAMHSSMMSKDPAPAADAPKADAAPAADAPKTDAAPAADAPKTN